MKRSVILMFLIPIAAISFSQESPKIEGLKLINHKALISQTTFLASDWTEGRETGEKGAYMSADYIASMLQLFGVEPGGDERIRFNPATRRASTEKSYFQEFNLMKTSPGDIQEFSIVQKSSSGRKVLRFNNLTDFSVTPTEPGGVVEAEVVFVGYGYVDKEKGWDDFSKKDVKGKFILRIAGVPPALASNDQINNRLSVDKDGLASFLGVAGIIEVDPSGLSELQWAERKDFTNMSPAEGRPSRPRIRYSIPQNKIANTLPRVNVSIRVANALLASGGITIEEFVDKKMALSSVKETAINSVILNTSVITSMVKVRNVIGIIEGKKSDEVIVLGAHYDHIGMYGGFINNGADDNASGTVAVLTLARAIMGTGVKPEKSIVFALWTAEEKGLLGSRYFVEYPTVPFDDIKMNLNYDMISRYISDDKPNAVTMTYSDTHPYFREITEKNITEYGIEIEPDYLPSDNPPGGSDHRSFVAKGIPVMRFKPGHREEYHTPADEISTLDWDIMEKIVKISFLNVWDLANTSW